MASAAFGTFQAARALESADVERTQAEAIAEAIQQRQDYATNRMSRGLAASFDPIWPRLIRA